jgi:hypothetical protein
MLLGTASIYESFNGGDSLTNFGLAGQFITSLSYGSRLNGLPFPDVFYVGTATNSSAPTPQIFHRMTLGGPITLLSAYPGGTIRSLVMDPQNYTHVFVVDSSSRVWTSMDEGATWTELTANLPMLMRDVRKIEIFSPSSSPLNTVLIVGGLGGVFQMRRPGAAGTSWTPLGTNLPHALFTDLRYDYPCDVLTAGTLGRGVFTITGAFRGASTANCPAVAVMAVGNAVEVPDLTASRKSGRSDPAAEGIVAGNDGALPVLPSLPPVANPGRPDLGPNN